MGIFENPVLHRELLVNLRMHRAFILLFFYQLLLAAVVLLSWPQENVRLDLSEAKNSSQLIDLFFLGQFVLASLMAPSFAAAAFSGEKERKTFEMLLASPLQPKSIVFGKGVASLTHLAILIFSSLPIVMLCLPLGGVSIYEVLAAYFAMLLAVITFGVISIACSSYFKRTSASLVVSYLLVLPLALACVVFWQSMSGFGATRLQITYTVLPGVAMAICIPLFYVAAARLLYPPDMGSEGKEVVDIEVESEQAVGLVIQPDQFPDNLFAPPKRKTLMDDRVNPVYDKEMRSEIFGQGTLMLRIAIQISMVLAIILMAIFLYLFRSLAPFYIVYVIVFNILIGPVFSAGSVTSERERETLDLLLTTTITPWQIMWGKLLSGLRVSTVLTSFVAFPILLAVPFVADFRQNILTFLAYFVIIVLTCLTTSTLALFCSCVFRKSSVSLLVTYTIIVTLFCMPLAADFFAQRFFPDSDASAWVYNSTVSSPFKATFEFPLYVQDNAGEMDWTPVSMSAENQFFGYPLADLRHFGMYTAFTLLLNAFLFVSMNWLFNMRWRVSSSTE